MLDTSSDEEEPKPENKQHTTKPDEKEETKLTASTSKTLYTPARSSQRTKKKPNWHGQNVIMQKVEKQPESQVDDKSETKTEEEVKRE